MPNAQELAEATTALLYLSPYVRHAGCNASASAWEPITLPASIAATGPNTFKWAPFVPEPPSAVTTHSFNELVKQRTRPVRYGPHEVSTVAAVG